MAVRVGVKPLVAFSISVREEQLTAARAGLGQ